MAPLAEAASLALLPVKRAANLLARANETDPSSAQQPAVGDQAWQGDFSVTSVDLIAMVVSDAGLASATPEWWNCSPKGCVLIGLQPRGGWQVMQRAVQWGNDKLSQCFGIKCDMPVLYQYFACSVRNRIEVFNETLFVSPTLGPESDTEKSSSGEATNGQTAVQVQHNSVNSKKSSWWASLWNFLVREKEEPKPTPWKQFDVDGRGHFSISRPTKLVDGSRGGQAFMCELLCPRAGQAYGIEEQARMQFLSVLLVAATLTPKLTSSAVVVWEEMKRSFGMTTELGKVFGRLWKLLVIFEIPVLGFMVVVCYSLWRHNLFGGVVPYAIQLSSLCTWSLGAMGLLMLGGNPRVHIEEDFLGIPDHVYKRLWREHRVARRASTQTHPRQGERITDEDGNVPLQFGFLQGGTFQPSAGESKLTFVEVEAIVALKMTMKRTWKWKLSILWYATHLLASIVLQIASATTATLGSQAMGVAILITTSVFRGMGVAGDEKWMIPNWAMRKGATYGAALQGKFLSRAT